METDRNLLFGIISMQAGLIDAAQFVEACSHWATRKDVSLAELLLERRLINETDRSHVEYLLERRLEKQSGGVQASLESVPEAIRRSLRRIADPDINASLARHSPGNVDLAETQVFTVAPPVASESAVRYELTEVHATGGMGRVWQAWDRILNRSVALKELKPELADDVVHRARFHREATITGQLEHPGIVPVYDLVFAPDHSRSFYTMRFVDGCTLAEAARAFHDARVQADADTTAFVHLLNAFVAVCNTVAYAHSRGVIHRDLKGQNVILGGFGETVVLDWGFAKQPKDVESDDMILQRAVPLDQANSELTVQGEAVGTPAYMAPEQAAGYIDLIDHRTDVYGLGAILYHVLTGQPPFRAPNVDEVLRKVQSEPPIPPGQIWADVPKTLESACLRALAKRPSDRFASAAELGREVEQWQEIQRRQAEQALRASEALYRSLVDVLPLILVRKDLASRFTFANKRFCEAMGKPLEGIVGKTDFDFFPAEIARDYQQNDRHVFERQEPLETEEKFPDHGEMRDIRVIKTPTFDSRGELSGLQIIVWDVTEGKQLKEALQQKTDEVARLREHVRALRSSR